MNGNFSFNKKGFIKLFALLFIIFPSHKIGGQSIDYSINTNDAGRNIPNILPPSPESFKLSEYGNIPMGLFIGSPNINIPLATFKSGNTQIPISLNYTSNGIRIDEMNGSVGLGWVLISAGVITRIVRDKPDETIANNQLEVPNIDSLGIQNTSVSQYLKNCEDDLFDSEQDLYIANFLGHNIKFIFDKKGLPILLDKKNYQIHKNTDNHHFTITTDDGTKYYFDAEETVINMNTNSGFHNAPLLYPYSWYLSQIVDIRGHVVNIDYYDINYTATLSRSQTMTYTPPSSQQLKYGSSVDASDISTACPTWCPKEPYNLPANNLGPISDLRQTVSGKQIKKIYDNSNNSIIFSYSSQSEDYNILTNLKKYSGNELVNDITLKYTNTNNNRLFLIKILDNRSQSSYQFDYYNNDLFPERLSFSRDKWGYYNGQNNSSLIPQIFDANDQNAVVYSGANQNVNPNTGYYGLLKTITYPTGGTTSINYENHLLYSTKKIYAPLYSTALEATNDATKTSTTITKSIVPLKSGYVHIFMGTGISQNSSCINSPLSATNKQKGIIDVTDSLGNHLTLLTYNPALNGYIISSIAPFLNSLNNKNDFYVYVNKGQLINITLTSQWFCSDTSANIFYYSSDDQEINTNIPIGGYRIFRTIDTPTDGLPVTRTFNYLNDLGIQSTHQTREPYFLENKSIGSTCNSNCQSEVLYINYISLTSSNVHQLISINPNIFYDTVTEEISNNGKIVHYFNINSDYPGVNLKGNQIVTAPWTNFGWDNGKEIRKVYTDIGNNVVKTIQYEYVEDPTKQSVVRAIARRKFFEPTLRDDTWNEFENLDIVLYKNISRFTYLKSIIETNYFKNKPITNTTIFSYDNSQNSQNLPITLKKELTIFSDNTLNETTYQYATEKSNQYLLDRNMVGIPLETTMVAKKDSVDTGKVVSDIEVHYPTSQTEADTSTSGLPLPMWEKPHDLQTGSLGQGVTYDKYDPTGNLLQYTSKAGVPTTIIWGYGGTEPVAKIEGATYTQVAAQAAQLASASDTTQGSYSEVVLLSQLDALRKSFPQYQITTYTYAPLVGVTSITPPSGIREYYHYDSANRLDRVTDANGKVIKEYKYNYKQ